MKMYLIKIGIGILLVGICLSIYFYRFTRYGEISKVNAIYFVQRNGAYEHDGFKKDRLLNIEAVTCFRSILTPWNYYGTVMIFGAIDGPFLFCNADGKPLAISYYYVETKSFRLHKVVEVDGKFFFDSKDGVFPLYAPDFEKNIKIELPKESKGISPNELQMNPMRQP